MVTQEVKKVIVSSKVGKERTGDEIAKAIKIIKTRKSLKGTLKNGIKFLISKGVIHLV